MEVKIKFPYYIRLIGEEDASVAGWIISNSKHQAIRNSKSEGLWIRLYRIVE